MPKSTCPNAPSESQNWPAGTSTILFQHERVVFSRNFLQHPLFLCKPFKNWIGLASLF